MIYEISHSTTCRYSSPVSQSQHLLHLSPRNHARQSVTRPSLIITPAPATQTDLTDDFGNRFSIITIERDYTELVIRARSQVDVQAPPAIELGKTTSWNDVAAQLRANLGPETFEATKYSCPSRYIRPSRTIYDYAKPSLANGRPLLEAVFELTGRIYKDFAYAPGATDISTPVEDVLKLRRGVCQDFAHLQIACLRTFGIAVRYVSGYLLTTPPPGQPKLIGSDASHAWISVWCPDAGWVDFDPTNNLMPTDQHIVLGFGRDYNDVSPVNGVLLGGGNHEIEVAVDVTPLEGAAVKV